MPHCDPGSVAGEIARLIDLGGARTVVDVGGGDGALVLSLLRAYPELSGTVFELPDLVDAAFAAVHGTNLLDRFLPVAGDYLVTAPPSADWYLLNGTLGAHSCPERHRILANCRVSAWAGARVLMGLIAPPA